MISIAIDGPSGAGKSTVSKELAKRLGFIYIDTGAMYRTLAWKAIEEGIDIGSRPDKIDDMLARTEIDIKYAQDGQHMYADGRDVTAFIRTPEVSMGASRISALPSVREWLLGMQRGFAEKNSCIMDGRDIGTVVLPDADVKIFLTASPEARARRRLDDLCRQGIDMTFDEVLSDINERDKRDSSRDCAPLAAAHDAVTVDSGGIGFEDTVSLIMKIISDRVGE